MPAKASGHDLIVGGSGMLVALCKQLAAHGRIVSVVGRNRSRLQDLVDQAGFGAGRINPLALDYRDANGFARSLKTTSDAWGPFERVVCWVHEETAPLALMQAGACAQGPFWHLLGSATADPAEPSALMRWQVRFREALPTLDYRQVVLGFIAGRAGESSRWLTDSEICGGVYAAMTSPNALAIVGAVEPWSARP